jgi:hypothetical protein
MPMMIMSDTIKKNTKVLLDAGKEVGLEVNPEKTKYMLVSRCQKAGQRQSIKTVNRSFEDVAKFKYLETILTDQNCIHEEIKSILNFGNACYHSVQSLLSPCLLSTNVKVKIYTTIILPVILYGCETWSLTLREDHRLGVFENRVLRRIFGPKRDEVTGEWRKLHSEELHNLYSYPDIIRQVKANEVGGTCGTHGRGENCTRFWWESPKERDHWEDQGVGGKKGSELILGRLAWIGFDWLRTWTGGGLL